MSLLDLLYLLPRLSNGSILQSSISLLTLYYFSLRFPSISRLVHPFVTYPSDCTSKSGDVGTRRIRPDGLQ